MKLRSINCWLAAVALVALPAAYAQITAPGQSAAAQTQLEGQRQVEAQRRAELRRMLHQKQSAEASTLRLTPQQRAELRDVVRRQQPRPEVKK